jgi:hypothetical protein
MLLAIRRDTRAWRLASRLVSYRLLARGMGVAERVDQSQALDRGA